MVFVWVIAAGLLQMTVLRDVNLMVVLAVFAGLRKGPVFGFLLGALIGLFVEMLSGSTFGLNLALYSAVGLLSGIAKSQMLYRESVLMEFLFSFSGVLVFYLGYFILTKRTPPSIFATALFSAAVSPIVFRFVKI
ncbi:MAG: hypothetical protein KJ706_07250 [Candidatus Omnitrophica bacterium]|nr:hypothetical protein [Candidatus Omnitrophota bacterium]